VVVVVAVIVAVAALCVLQVQGALVKDGTVGATVRTRDGRRLGETDFAHAADLFRAWIEAGNERTDNEVLDALVKDGTFGTALDLWLGRFRHAELTESAFAKAWIKARKQGADGLALETTSYQMMGRRSIFGCGQGHDQCRGGNEDKSE
jgi:hypothetical protein